MRISDWSSTCALPISCPRSRTGPRRTAMSRADPLAQYNAKRDFKLTPEPAGKIAKGQKRQARNRFIVQKHDATRLHYDFRLEVDGVRSEEHTSELQSLMRISYAVFCLKKKKRKHQEN